MSVTIFRQNCFCLTVPNHFLEETFCVSESFGYLKCLCLRGDFPRFSMDNLLSPVPKNFVDEPICVWQNFLHRKILGIRGGEGVSVTISRQNGFCLTVSNHFVEETFCVSESFGYRKGLCLRGDYPRFSMESLLSPVPENFVEEPICVSQTFLYRKILGIRGGRSECHDFPSKWFLSHSIKLFPRGTHLCFTEISVSKDFRNKRGGGKSECHIFPSK